MPPLQVALPLATFIVFRGIKRPLVETHHRTKPTELAESAPSKALAKIVHVRAEPELLVRDLAGRGGDAILEHLNRRATF